MTKSDHFADLPTNTELHEINSSFEDESDAQHPFRGGVLDPPEGEGVGEGDLISRVFKLDPAKGYTHVIKSAVEAQGTLADKMTKMEIIVGDEGLVVDATFTDLSEEEYNDLIDAMQRQGFDVS